MTLLLIGLILVSSISGSLTVVCHGADGHVAVEPLVHDHCECPETDLPKNPVSIGSDCLDSHGHCTDYDPASHLITPTKQSTHQGFTPALTGYVDSLIHSYFLSKLTSQDDHLPAFYTPLRTVILLV
jgi:hypothetical protein